jgi:hypothetical protein
MPVLSSERITCITASPTWSRKPSIVDCQRGGLGAGGSRAEHGEGRHGDRYGHAAMKP